MKRTATKNTVWVDLLTCFSTLNNDVNNDEWWTMNKWWMISCVIIIMQAFIINLGLINTTNMQCVMIHLLSTDCEQIFNAYISDRIICYSSSLSLQPKRSIYKVSLIKLLDCIISITCRRLSDMKCTVMIWRSWVQTPVGSNLGVRGTSLLSCTWTKNIYNASQCVLNCKYKEYFTRIDFQCTKTYFNYNWSRAMKDNPPIRHDLLLSWSENTQTTSLQFVMIYCNHDVKQTERKLIRQDLL